jgi:hypothetical protein
MNASKHAQFSVIMTQVYSRLPKRMSQNNLVTFAGSSRFSQRALAETMNNIEDELTDF